MPGELDGIGFHKRLQEIRPELEAYAEFCRYRDEQRKGGVDPASQRERLEEQRREMFARIKRRRARRMRQGGTLFSLSDQPVKIPRYR